MIAPSIQLDNITLAYQSIPLIHQLNLKLEAQQCTCILGPSGVGKSSLLRLIAGLIDPKHHTDATLISGCISCSDQQPHQSRMAYMPQTAALMPWLTVLDNITLGYRLRQLPIPREKALSLLDAVGLQKNALDYPQQLSGGMKQRVALARTLMEDKPIILMDEPFASLDVITKWQLHDYVNALLKDKTVFLVTHDPLEALRLADTIHVLSGNPASIQQSWSIPLAKPRLANNPDILAYQAELIAALTLAKEYQQ